MQFNRKPSFVHLFDVWEIRKIGAMQQNCLFCMPFLLFCLWLCYCCIVLFLLYFIIPNLFVDFLCCLSSPLCKKKKKVFLVKVANPNNAVLCKLNNFIKNTFHRGYKTHSCTETYTYIFIPFGQLKCGI